MKSKQEIIDEVMDEMDFEKIHKVMVTVNWQWANVGIPNIPQIRKFLRQQLNQFLDENLRIISCGGFTIIKQRDHIHVTFELTTYDIYFDETSD